MVSFTLKIKRCPNPQTKIQKVTEHTPISCVTQVNRCDSPLLSFVQVACALELSVVNHFNIESACETLSLPQRFLIHFLVIFFGSWKPKIEDAVWKQSFFLLFLESWTPIWKGSFLPTLYGSSPSATLKMNEQHLSPLEQQPAPEEPTKSWELAWLGGCQLFACVTWKKRKKNENITGQDLAEKYLASQLLGKENEAGNILSILWLKRAENDSALQSN